MACASNEWRGSYWRCLRRAGRLRDDLANLSQQVVTGADAILDTP